LGRILPVEGVVDSVFVGEQNSKRWIFEVVHEGGPVTFEIQLVDWRTSRRIPKGLLQPAPPAPLTREAALATVYFPVCDDGRLGVSIEPEPVPGAPPDVGRNGILRFRFVVDAVHSLMR
jgi:hypothetical protein